MPTYTANPRYRHGSYKIPGLGIILRYPYEFSTLIQFDEDDPGIVEVNSKPTFQPILYDRLYETVTTIDSYNLLDAIPLDTPHIINITPVNGSIKIFFNWDRTKSLSRHPGEMFSVTLENRYLGEISIAPENQTATYNIRITRATITS